MKKVLAMGVVALFLSACGGDKAAQTTTANDTATKTSTNAEPTTPATSSETAEYVTYQVGSDIGYEPFAFQDEHGQPIGFEIDLLNAMGKAAKFNVEFIHESRSELVPTLDNGKFDLWSSTLSVSPERKEKVDFSEPYTNFVRQIYILDKPENSHLQTPADFQGKKISVNKSSKSFVEEATKLTGSPEGVVEATSFMGALREVYTGKADGTLGDSRLLQYFQLKHGDNVQTRIIDMGDTPKDIAFAVKKGNTEVLEKLNQGLAAVKADGTYDKLVEKWFGQIAQAQPQAETKPEEPAKK